MLKLQRNAKGISIKIQLMLISLANKLKWQGAQLSQLFIAGLRDINSVKILSNAAQLYEKSHLKRLAVAE